MKLGNIRESSYDLQELLQSDPAKQILAFIHDKGCHCTHECYFMTNILFNPRLIPALARQALQLPRAQPARGAASFLPR